MRVWGGDRVERTLGATGAGWCVRGALLRSRRSKSSTLRTAAAVWNCLSRFGGTATGTARTDATHQIPKARKSLCWGCCGQARIIREVVSAEAD
jgi:hypothetical protein